MMFDEAMRYRLHARLQEVLGADEADALMAVLPPFAWSDLVTKEDLRAELVLLRSDLRGDMQEMRADLHSTITAQTRQVFFGLIGVVAAFGGLILTASRLGH